MFIQEPYSKAPIPIPIPDVTPLNPPLGVVPPLPPKITLPQATPRSSTRWPRSCKGIAYAGQHSDSVFGTGSLDVARYGRVLRVAAARRRTRRRRRLQRPLLRHQRDPPDQARRVHAVVHARPQRPALDPPGGARMTDARQPATTSERFYGKYRGTCVNNVDPMQIGRIQVIGPRRLLGHPAARGRCRASRSPGSRTASSPCPPIGAGVWVEFEQGDPDYPIWVGGFYAAADVPAMARAVPPGVSGFTFQTTLAEQHHDQRHPRPDRRHPDQDHDRRDDLGQRRRHHDHQRQGRDASRWSGRPSTSTPAP